jgi:hypothetical protein
MTTLKTRNENIARILESDDFDNRIEALRNEAAMVGDDATVEICDRAIEDNCDDARHDAAGILADAEAMDPDRR